MNCSPSAAGAIPAVPVSPTARQTAADASLADVIVSLPFSSGPVRPIPLRAPWKPTRAGPAMPGRPASVRERPAPELLLADMPEPGEAGRLDDQEEDDQRTEDHELDMAPQVDRKDRKSTRLNTSQ